MMLKFSDARTESGSDDSNAVSSANVAMSVSCVSGTLAVYNKLRSAPRTLPCGTPAVMR